MLLTARSDPAKNSAHPMKTIEPLRYPNATLELTNFPDYWFSEDGEAFRKAPIRRGPHSGSLHITTYLDFAGEICYKLTNAKGVRTTIRKKSVVQALQDQEAIMDLIPLPGFDTYFIDDTGHPYNLRRSGVLHKMNYDIGRNSERFVLYDSKFRRKSLSAQALLKIAGVNSNRMAPACL